MSKIDDLEYQLEKLTQTVQLHNRVTSAKLAFFDEVFFKMLKADLESQSFERIEEYIKSVDTELEDTQSVELAFSVYSLLLKAGVDPNYRTSNSAQYFSNNQTLAEKAINTSPELHQTLRDFYHDELDIAINHIAETFKASMFSVQAETSQKVSRIISITESLSSPDWKTSLYSRPCPGGGVLFLAMNLDMIPPAQQYDVLKQGIEQQRRLGSKTLLYLDRYLTTSYKGDIALASVADLYNGLLAAKVPHRIICENFGTITQNSFVQKALMAELIAPTKKAIDTLVSDTVNDVKKRI